MRDFLVAVGLVLAVEGLIFAALPGLAKRLAATALETPEGNCESLASSVPCSGSW
jgi:uncharacterized protein YjeT (DUF2065 family)